MLETKDKRFVYFGAFALFLLTICVYQSAMHANFVWDDWIYLYNSDKYIGLKGILSSLQEPFLLSPDYFRPLVQFTFSIQLFLFGRDPSFFHFFNIIVHAINVSMLYVVLCMKISISSESRAKTLLICACYAASPISVEYVAWISGRFDVLLVTFFIPLLYITTYVRVSLSSCFLVFMLYLLMSMTKESAVTVPLSLCVLWGCLVGNSKFVTDFKAVFIERFPYLISMMVAGVLYLLYRYFSLGYLLSGFNQLDENTLELLAHTKLVFVTFGAYLCSLLIPFFSISLAHPINFFSPMETLESKIYVFFAIIFICISLFSILQKRRFGYFGIGIVFLVLPFSNIRIIPSVDDYYMLRYLSLPLTVLAFYVSKCIFLSKDGRLNALEIIFISVYLGVSLVVTARTIPHWNNEIALWKWAYNTHPNSERAFVGYIYTLILSGKNEEVISMLEACDCRDKQGLVMLGNLAAAYKNVGRLQDSIDLYELLFRVYSVPQGSEKREIANIYAAYALLRIEQGDKIEAQAAVKECLKNNPEHLFCVLYDAALKPEVANSDIDYIIARFASSAKNVAIERVKKIYPEYISPRIQTISAISLKARERGQSSVRCCPFPTKINYNHHLPKPKDAR